MALLMQTIERRTHRLAELPRHLWIGLLLVSASWLSSWFGPDRAREIAFVPLWLGYILTVDGIVRLRAGSSLMSRNRREFALLFLISSPLWWVFELANLRLDNWSYRLPYSHSWLHYHLHATIAFSTVLPAIFETSDLIATTRVRTWGRSFVTWNPDRRGLIVISALGMAVFASSLIFPGQFFPLAWVGLFFAIDPINQLRGAPSLSARVARGNWSAVLVLFAAGLICGFFWEMWNYWSMPRWEYSVPYADRFRIFEMPLLGYGGYLPFTLELYAAYHLVRSFLPDPPASPLLVDGDSTAAPKGGRSA